MIYQTPAEAFCTAQATDIPCPVCDAEATLPCTTPTGKSKKAVHGDRLNTARRTAAAAARYPLICALPRVPRLYGFPEARLASR